MLFLSLSTRILLIFDMANAKSFWLGLFIVMLMISPYIIFGENSIVIIHDFLDSNPVHIKTIISLGLVGNPEGIMPIMDGLPSLQYMPLIPISIKSILYMLLPLYWAITAHLFFVKMMAFVGMYLFCINYMLKRNHLCSLLMALLFSLVPFYSDYGLSSAGVPLFLYCASNLETKVKLPLSFFLLLLFACNSSFVLVGFFICLIWCIWIIIKWKKENLLPKYHLYGLIVVFNYFQLFFSI